MGRKRTPGLYKRGEHWHIDKKIFGKRICESTGSGELEEAEHYLAKRSEEIRQATIYGVRPKRTFREAATKFLIENQHKATIQNDARWLQVLDSYIGDLPLESIHMGSLQKYIEARKNEGVKCRTINHGLQLTRRILNLATGEWIDEYGLTWLINAPRIKLLSEHDKRRPYPLTWDEQNRLFEVLPLHLKQMALFGVNTGCRDAEICSLQWKYEVKTDIPNYSVFVIPGFIVKNREDRLVVLNKIAKEVIEGVRGNDSNFVFTFKNKPIQRMLNSAWLRARAKVGLHQVRVHDLKHTFGRRLRSAGVSFEDRQDLLGHKSSRITTHYSAAELNKLLEAANKVCYPEFSSPTLTALRRAVS